MVVERYAIKLRALVETWEGRDMANICYMAGQKMRLSDQHWSTARRLTYPGQCLARLGYWDEAHGLPNRLKQEEWSLCRLLKILFDPLRIVEDFPASVDGLSTGPG